MTTPTLVVEYTNHALAEWHTNTKRDYGHVGAGMAKFNPETNMVEIFYRIGSIECLFEHYYHSDSEVDTAWRMWMQCRDWESDAARYRERNGNH
jgi:hypothetical protein